MQFSACSFFALLISQALWRVTAVHDARLVRKSAESHLAARSVSATGEIIEIEDTKDERPLIIKSASGEPIMDADVAVSANGDTTMVQHGVSASLLDTRTEDLLNEVADLVSSRTTPEPDKIKVIKDIITDELVPDLKKTRDAAEKQIADNLALISKCNSNSNTQQSSIKSTTKVSVGERRTTHVTCRDEEKNKEGDKNGKCEELDTFLGAITLPSDMPAGKPREGMVDYVKEMSGYFCPKEPTVTELDDACKQAEKKHAENKALCDKKQASFEVGFCTWRTELKDECTELSTCYDSAVTAHNTYVAETKELVKKWKTEYASLKKILCYTNVWMNDANAKTVDADQFSKCRDTDIDTSPMDIEYPQVPEKAACDIAPVSKYPGTTEFVTVEYATFSQYANTPIPCLTEGETPDKTLVPTEAPTTPPTEAPTEAAPTGAPTTPPTEAPPPTTTTVPPTTTAEAETTTVPPPTTTTVPLKIKVSIPKYIHYENMHQNDNCWEPGNEEYTMKDLTFTLQGEVAEAIACKHCTKNGNCVQEDVLTQTYDWGEESSKTLNTKFEAFENDHGDRCTHSGSAWYRNDDDCHLKADKTWTVNKGQNGEEEFGDANHKVTVKWQFY